MKTGIGRQLDPNIRSKAVEEFETALRRIVIGQEGAVDALVERFQTFKAGLNPSHKPVGTLLFLGPTGTGKTKAVEAAAEILFGDEHALIKIDCGEFQHSHEIAKLVGSPPGYLGHRETHPVLTQEAINQYHTPELKLTLLLVDEIEKASDSLWQLLLGILDKATLTLGDNRKVDLSSCLIIMTSNIGAAEMSSMTTGGIGFTTKKAQDDELDTKIQTTAVDAARRKFSPEFMNRIDRSVVFKTLRQGHLEQILELELAAIQQRIFYASGTRFIFGCSDDVKKHLLKEGTDLKYGARHLKRSIERNLVAPLSNLSATGQIHLGDFIRVSFDHKGEYIFTVESENSVLPVILARLSDMGVTTANRIPPPEATESPEIKRAMKRLRESEEKLMEAKKRRKELDNLDSKE